MAFEVPIVGRILIIVSEIQILFRGKVQLGEDVRKSSTGALFGPTEVVRLSEL